MACQRDQAAVSAFRKAGAFDTRAKRSGSDADAYRAGDILCPLHSSIPVAATASMMRFADSRSPS